MTGLELKNEIHSQLTPLYGDREASLMAQYYCEDFEILSSTMLSKEDLDLHHTRIVRLTNYEPLQYVTGIAHFYGLKYKVDNAVLIPRPETEELVHQVMTLSNDDITSFLDIGTGSGCIINTIAYLHKKKEGKYYGIDISPKALDVASGNANTYQLGVNFIAHDFLDESLWNHLPKVDCLISNPPYIASEEATLMQPNVLRYEPHIALFSHEDSLLFYKKLAKYMSISPWIKSGFFEINEHLGHKVEEIFESLHLPCDIIKDLQGKDRIVRVLRKTI